MSDLTAQFWCEQKMEYSYELPAVPVTAAMQQGADIHLSRGSGSKVKLNLACSRLSVSGNNRKQAGVARAGSGREGAACMEQVKLKLS